VKLKAKAEIQLCTYYLLRRFSWVKVDFLILQIVGAASTKVAVTVGGNALLMSGRKTKNTDFY